MALSGPNLPPARGPATHLVVLVHGYGADGNDLIGLAAHWQGLLPTVAFAAPNAPSRVPGAPGFQWFPISRIDPHEMQKGVEVAGPVLEEYLDAELARLGIPPENLALAGFSQGTMLSLHVGLRRKVKPAAIVGFSGMLPAPPPAARAPRRSTPTVMVCRMRSTVALARCAARWSTAPACGRRPLPRRGRRRRSTSLAASGRIRPRP